jgi:hypothetical protein
MTAFTIKLDPVGRLTDEAFYQLCLANPDIKFERSAKGELIIMSPTGGESGRPGAAPKPPLHRALGRGLAVLSPGWDTTANLQRQRRFRL